MLAADIPTKIQTPWAAQSTLVTDIPQTPGSPGRASWQQGFPALNMEPVASGGIPPFGQDMNGALQAMSNWLRWAGAGGPVSYDSGFSSTVGGYPRGAVLQATSGLGWWVSQADNNTSDPDAGGGSWLFSPLEQTWDGDPNGNVAGQAGALNQPPSLCWDVTDFVFWYCTTTGDAAGAVWAPLVNLQAVRAQAGAAYPYTLGDNGCLIVRSNAGSAMADPLPSSFANGWSTSVFNNDASGLLTLSVPSGKKLNGVTDGTLILRPTQTTKVTGDADGNFWLSVPPVPVVFSGQAIYVNISDTYPPGVYDIDTTAGPVTFTLETGGVVGDNYHFRDVAGTFAKNNLVIDPGANTIQGQAGTFTCDVPWTDFVLSRNTTSDWSLV